VPRIELREEHGTLDPLASFKVLAVMCHPNSRIGREKMMAHIQKEIGEGIPRRQPLSSEEFHAEVWRVATRAGVAGGLLLTMIQLCANGYRATLNQAMPLVAALLPQWQQPVGPYWSKDAHVGHRPHGRVAMLAAFNEYRSVAHQWAALLHGQQHDRQDIWPGQNKTLPVFIAYSEAILDLGCRLPSFVPGRRFAVTRSSAWHFTIPEVPAVTLKGLPFSQEQLALFDEHLAAKALI
jgi:hypothetical protein